MFSSNSDRPAVLGQPIDISLCHTNMHANTHTQIITLSVVKETLTELTIIDYICGGKAAYASLWKGIVKMMESLLS